MVLIEISWQDQLPNAKVRGIGDVQRAVGAESHASEPRGESSPSRRPTVAREPRDTGSGDRGDDALSIDLPDAAAVAARDVEVADCVEEDSERDAEGRLLSGPSVTGVSASAGPCDCGDDPMAVDPADPMV